MQYHARPSAGQHFDAANAPSLNPHVIPVARSRPIGYLLRTVTRKHECGELLPPHQADARRPCVRSQLVQFAVQALLSIRRFLVHKVLPCSLLALALGVARADEWPQYRGPYHDGVSTEPLRTNWAAVPPRQLWRVPLDPALSSLTISGGRVFTQVRRLIGGLDTEFCVALDAQTGQELWAAPVDMAASAEFPMYPNEGVGDDDGPRSTPSVIGNRVYVLSTYLHLHCLDAATGQTVWSRDLTNEFGGTLIEWQNGASPLVLGGRVLLNGNGPGQRLMAFDASDGALAWAMHDDAMTQASPVGALIDGVPQAIFFTQSGLVSVAPATGGLLWRRTVNYNFVSVAASPVVAGNRVYCSRAYAGSTISALAGALVIGVTNTAGTFNTAQVWYRTNQLMNHWATPVHYQGHLYGNYGQGFLTFKCVEFATGAERWSVSGFGYGSALVAGTNILAFSDTGALVLVAPRTNAYTEIARYQGPNGKCWNAPALSNGRIYARSTTEAVCLDVSVPRLRLAPAPPVGPAFRVTIGSHDGTPLTSNRVARITVSAATNPALALAQWTPLTNGLVFTNGQLRLDDSASPAQPRRFYRAQEQ